MDEDLVQKWNSVVKDEDIVYHLGDVYFPGGYKEDDGIWNLLSRLRGRKRLILGNHDDAKNKALQKYFQKIGIWRMFPEFGLLLTHVPVHESCLGDRTPVNIHGHIHNRAAPSPKHRCVSVEHTGYTPVNIERLRVK
jgi:calcineurin-like phosphoesterase family protein